MRKEGLYLAQGFVHDESSFSTLYGLMGCLVPEFTQKISCELFQDIVTQKASMLTLAESLARLNKDLQYTNASRSKATFEVESKPYGLGLSLGVKGQDHRECLLYLAFKHLTMQDAQAGISLDNPFWENYHWLEEQVEDNVSLLPVWAWSIDVKSQSRLYWHYLPGYFSGATLTYVALHAEDAGWRVRLGEAEPIMERW